MTLRSWWEEYPGLLEAELDELEMAGIRHELDVEFRDKHGAVKIIVWPLVDGEERRMEAVFPDLYPWFRPEVISADDDLPKHQGPFGKNLCLLPRESGSWHVGHDSLAGLLVTQLPSVYESQESPDADQIEVHQAEPFTAYYDNGGVGALTVDSAWDLGQATHGTFEYGLFRQNLVFGKGSENSVFVGVVLRVYDSDENEIACADDHLLNRFDDAPIFSGRWQRRPAPLRIEHPAPARSLVRKEHRHLVETQYEMLGPEGSPQADVVGLVFPIEAEYGGGIADAWTFLASFAPRMSRKEKRSLGKRELHQHGHTHWIPGERGGLADLAVRVPQLGPLRGKTVLVVGTGGIGAPAAQHLAQSGANIRLVDGDVVEPATGVRYPLGHDAAGRYKVVALSAQIGSHSPLSQVGYAPVNIGRTRISGQGTSIHELMNTVLDGVDMIFDATGDHAVGQFLSDRAGALNIPFVNVSTTFGAWGGRVIALCPSSGACFECIAMYIDDRSGDDTPVEERLIPPAEPNGEIRPAGCADATYTGTSFDAVAVVAVGVRAAVSLLCEGEDGAYPPIGWNVAITHHRNQDGVPIAGRSYEFDLPRRTDCPECHRRSG